MEAMNSSQCENNGIPLWLREPVSEHKLSISISSLRTYRDSSPRMDISTVDNQVHD